MVRITTFLFLFTFVIIGCNHPESRQYERHNAYQSPFSETTPTEKKAGYKVIGVNDGDTFVLLIDGKEQVVRFAHIDCFEKKQSFGNKVKQFFSDLCFSTYVTLIVSDKNKYDRNKRLIAEVILEDGRNLNKELVKNGLAWHFKKYSDNEEYARLETEARSNKIEIWSEPNPTAPLDWRKPKK